MVAAVREPLTAQDVRKLVYGLLPLWGQILRHGTPVVTDYNRLRAGQHPDSRLPAPAWFFDLSIAFSRLNPATSGLADAGDTAWLVHAPFNDLQRAIWAYYVEGTDTPLDLRQADKQQWAHDRDREIAKAQKARGWRADDEIARRLHITGRKARSLRTNAVWLMATLVNWDADLDDCPHVA